MTQVAEEPIAALEVSNLCLSFGGVVALDRLDLGVREGEVRCVIGPNGAGKTTFLNAVSGVVRPDSGRILLNGRESTNLSAPAVARRGLVRSFQTPTVFAGLSVRTNVELGARRPTTATDDVDHAERVDVLLDMLGLAYRAEAHAADLSHGEKKRLELAMLMASPPRLLLLDEPTAGMSTRETQEISELIQRLRGAMTVVIVEHDMAFVRGIAESVSVLHRGRLFAEGAVNEVAQDPRVRDIYLGDQPG
jgi:urea transport system ATP-binding protein